MLTLDAVLEMDKQERWVEIDGAHEKDERRTGVCVP